jgi:Ser/Thr protein kinase RdoA (MazF antagonist)
MPDSFFDAVTGRAADRGVAQFVLVGPWRGGVAPHRDIPGTRWWDVDSGEPGLAATLTGSGFEPDSPALFCCGRAASGLSQPALATLLAELRSLATPGTRLALALPAEAAHDAETDDLLHRSRWRPIEISERAQRAGLRMLAPVWAAAPPGVPPTAGQVAAFTERMLYRSGSDAIASHLQAAYGVTVTRTLELDLGVHRVDLAGGASWIARVFPAVRDTGAVRQDAQLLTWLYAQGFPAERCASPDPVSVLEGQGVLVTQHAPGRTLAAGPASFGLLGRLLGQLHSMPAGGQPAAHRPGGAWHHLLPDGSPAAELAAARDLLHAARHRVPPGDADCYDVLASALEAGDACGDLPHTLVHPDFVPRNAIGQPGGDVTIIDWTGAGHGPRIVSLGCLLWAAGSKGNIEAAISGYRQSVALEPGEAGRLGAAMRVRPLILACWTFATGRDNVRSIAGWWDQHTHRIDAGAKHALAALQRPSGEA